jgi:thiamine-monophosphate kinase
MAGEFDFINWVRSRQKASDFLLVPPGDDLAVLKWPADGLLLVGADQVLDGVHFDSTVHTPRQIGRKAMNRNLSDCAAMACLPAAAVTTVALPRGVGVDYAKELYLGLCEAADPFDCPVVGGDTGSWDGKLVLTVTIMGRSAGVNPVTRRGARPGDSIYVTGPLGGSLLGRHMTFKPLVELARRLSRHAKPTAMIDLSDGLSRDLRHICAESGVGAVIEADMVPVHDDAHNAFRTDRAEPLQHALHDGEDYELLYTSREPAAVNRTCVGRIVEGSSILLQTRDGQTPLEPKGWQHEL